MPSAATAPTLTPDPLPAQPPDEKQEPRRRRSGAAAPGSSAQSAPHRRAPDSPNPPRARRRTATWAARAAPAGCRASRPTIHHAPAHRADRRALSRATPAHHRRLARPRELRQALKMPLAARLAHSEDQPDRTRTETARDEAASARKRVEPLRVVHDADERSLFRNVDSRLSTARPTRNRSGASPARKTNAVQGTALRPGRCSRRSRTLRTSCCTRVRELHLDSTQPPGQCLTGRVPHAILQQRASAYSPRAPPAPRLDPPLHTTSTAQPIPLTPSPIFTIRRYISGDCAPVAYNVRSRISTNEPIHRASSTSLGTPPHVPQIPVRPYLARTARRSSN